MLVPAPSIKGTPLLVLVSGAPGSGKSTLARKLAEHMRLPHVERALIFLGMRYTTDEYAPTLDAIAAQLQDRNNKIRKGHPYATKTSN